MRAPVTAFFNNKGGVGKTSLVYHLAWMYAHLGIRVLAADLDPQANLSAAFLDEEALERLWPDGDHPDTIFGCVQPLINRSGDIAVPHVEIVEDNIGLLVGDMFLSNFEELLSQEWPKSMDETEGPFRVLSSFWRIMQHAAGIHSVDIVLVDLGPNLGAINRTALLSSDHVVVPLAPDLFSLQGLRNLGPTFRRWRDQWKTRLYRRPAGLELPAGDIDPLGYVVLQHSERLDRPVQSYRKWIARIPEVYSLEVKGESTVHGISVGDDLNCIALLKHYRSLIPMAQEARKPIFDLKPADGAIGSHSTAARAAYRDFDSLARLIAQRIHLPGLEYLEPTITQAEL